MVDAGGLSQSAEFDVGDRVLGPALRHRGVRRLDYLAITHGDHDHIGGAMSLVRDFDPREIWYGTYVNNHAPSMQLQSMAVYKRTAWRWLLAGDRVELGGVEIRVHHPAPEDWQRQKVRNDDSVVMELRYGQVSLLMTGDVSREVEESLIPSLDLLPIVILKSPHHGSGSSSSQQFIDKVKPRVVLVSCGRGNPFGHPQPYVVERYRAVGAEILRTDMDGQIELVTDGVSIHATKFAKHAEAHEGFALNTKGVQGAY
jgi:competence protein ComEC